MKGEPVLILMVEDDCAHAEIAQRNLAKCRMANKIIHVEDGQQALDYLYNEGLYSDKTQYPKPNIIMLDLRLPKIDGLEVLEKIRGDKELCNIPVVVLTTSSAEIDIARAYSSHVNSYLVKPLDYEKFADIMDSFGYYWLAWNQFPEV